MSKLKLFRIEGREYAAESADAAYVRHMEGWHRVTDLGGGFPPLVPVFERSLAAEATHECPACEYEIREAKAAPFEHACDPLVQEAD